MNKNLNFNNSTELLKIVSKYFDYTQEEVRDSKKLYGLTNSGQLKQYYFNLLKKRAYSNYIKYLYIDRVIPLVKNIRKDIKILDAGCGLGTESLLCGILGANVTGIDISKERLNVAKNRIKFYENKFQTKLNVQFHYENILSHANKYDIIWVNEAISHINPINQFLKNCYYNLNDGGKLIVSDANKLNPHVYFQSKKDQIRSGGIYQNIIQQDLPKGKEISYAVERIFTIPSIKSLLSQFFKVKEVVSIRFLPYPVYKFNSNIFLMIERNVLRKIPILNLFSTTYVIISVKKS